MKSRVAVRVLDLEVGLETEQVFNDVRVALVTAHLKRRLARAALVDDLQTMTKRKKKLIKEKALISSES